MLKMSVFPHKKSVEIFSPQKREKFNILSQILLQRLGTQEWDALFEDLPSEHSLQGMQQILSDQIRTEYQMTKLWNGALSLRNNICKCI